MTTVEALTDTEIAQQEAEAEAHLRDIRARKALGAAPGIVMHIRTLIDAAAGRSERGVEIVKESTPLITGWVDDADELYAQMINWVMYWAEELNTEPPSSAVVAWSNLREVQGFRAGATPQGAQMLMRLQTMWLLTRNNRILGHDSTEAYQTDVARIVFSLKGRYPTAPRPEKPVMPRPCEKCGTTAVSAEWMSEDIRDVVVKCEMCGHQVDVGGSALVDALRPDSDEHRFLTIPQAAERVQRSVRTIEGWANTGPDHLRIPVVRFEGIRYVDEDELLRVFRAKLDSPKGGKGQARPRLLDK